MQFTQIALLIATAAIGINAAPAPQAGDATVVREVCGWGFINRPSEMSANDAAKILCGNTSCRAQVWNTRWNELSDGSYTVAEKCENACTPGGCV